jgi:Ras-related protein Rab-2A
VYDITDRSTFQNIEIRWLPDLANLGNSNLVKVLVGNKSDKASDRSVSTEEGKALAKKHGMMFTETSAK